MSMCLYVLLQGLGKTIQAITVAAYYKSKWPILVIVPSSVKYNWKYEFIKYLPSLIEDNIHIVKNGKDKIFNELIDQRNINNSNNNN